MQTEAAEINWQWDDARETRRMRWLVVVVEPGEKMRGGEKEEQRADAEKKSCTATATLNALRGGRRS